jgi:outer membrane protein assembly factor BamB
MKFNRVFFFVLVASLSILLSACGAAPTASWPGMATDGSRIYLADGQYIYQLLADGTEASRLTADVFAPARFPVQAENTKSFYAAPAFTSDGQMVIGSAAQSEHTFYSIDPATGAVKWTFAGLKSPWLAGALVLDDAIYAPAGDGKLYAFGLNGAKRWDFNASNHSLWTAPVSDGKLVYLATLDHEVFAISPEGKKIWGAKLDNGIVGAPSIMDGTLFVGTLSGNLYALNTADGSQKWVKALEGSIWGTPATDGDNVYIGTVTGTTGKFYALKAATGEIVWFKDEAGSITAGPLVTDNQVIYVTETGNIRFLDKSGERIKFVDEKGAPVKFVDENGATIDEVDYHTIPNAKLYTPPLLAGDQILIAPMNAKFLLASFNLKTGLQTWLFSPK